MPQKNSFFIIALIIIYVAAWIIQSTLLFNWDISWGLYEADRLLAGGNYAKDFFEPSPPMFLYLYSIPVAFSHIFVIPLTLAFRLFIFGLASTSLFICYKLLSSSRNILTKPFYLKLFLLTLAVTFLALPLPTDFGQREHIFFILIMPYLLLVFNRLLDREPSVRFSYTLKNILIGLLAGIGLAIKPFFPMTLIVIEVYYAYRKKSWLAWLRPETIAILLLFAIYILIIFLFHRNYITIIAPLIMRYHYQSYHFSWLMIFSNQALLFCSLIFLFYFTQWQSFSNSKEISLLINILFFSLLSFVLLYIIQRSPWEYHLFPAYSTAILLAVLLFTIAKHIGKQRVKIDIIQNVSFIIFAALIFSFPIWYSYGCMTAFLAYKQTTKNLPTILPELIQQPVYFLSTTMPPTFAIIELLQAKPVSQFAHFAWLAGMFKQPIKNEKQYQQLNQDKLFIVNNVTKELATYKPLFIFVDVQKNKPYFDGITFEYLKEFSNYPKFNLAWHAYRYYATIEKVDAYKFAIYKRIQ